MLCVVLVVGWVYCVEFDYMGFVGFVNLMPDLLFFMIDSHCWVVYLACVVLCMPCS